MAQSIKEQAEREMRDAAQPAPRQYTASPDRKPSPSQIYLVARLCLEALELTFPENRAAASSLIGDLQAAAGKRASGKTDDVPF